MDDAGDDIYVFGESGAKRIVQTVERVERSPYALELPAGSNPFGPALQTFVIASDPSDYDEAEGLLPLGYRGHVIGYALRDDLDLDDLPEVPDLDALLKAEASRTGNRNVAEWAAHRWVDQYEDDDFGRPVLINVCRYAKGQFFRGDVLTAQYLPGFRHASSYRGSHFKYAAPTWGEWPDKYQQTASTYASDPGLCAITDGWEKLIVELDGALDPEATPEYALCHPATLSVGSGETIRTYSLVEPSDDAAFTQWLYSDRLTPLADAIPSGAKAVIEWDPLTFRWQLVSALCP